MKDDIFKAIANIFSGKGGGLKLAILCVTFLGLVSMATDNDYELEASVSDGSKVSLKPYKGKEADNTNDDDEPSPDGDDQEQTS